MNILAIDPGKNGGFAFHVDTFKKSDVGCYAMSQTPGDIVDELKGFALEGCIVYMEQLVKFAGNKQSGSAAIEYGKNFGILEGAIMALGMRLKFVRAQEWQKHFSLGTKGKQTTTVWKNKLKAEAQRLFPDQKVTLKTADALLILEYARFKEK